MRNDPEWTDQEILKQLRKLAARWPRNRQLFVGDGGLYLAPRPMKVNMHGAFDSDQCIDAIGGIYADGGGW